MERDINLAKSGMTDLIYKTLFGLKADLSKPAETPEILADKKDKDTRKENDNSEDSDDFSSGTDSETESENESKNKFVNSARPRNESLESKKVTYAFSFFIIALLISFLCINMTIYNCVFILNFRLARRQLRKCKRRKGRRR